MTATLPIGMAAVIFSVLQFLLANVLISIGESASLSIIVDCIHLLFWFETILNILSVNMPFLPKAFLEPDILISNQPDSYIHKEND